jgi:hypothetical protein
VGLAAERVDGPIGGGVPGPGGQGEAASRPEREGHVGPGEHEAHHRLGHVPRLGGRRPHELAASGGVEEEVPHLDGGAALPRRVLDPRGRAALGQDARAAPVLPGRGLEPEAGDRRDGRQGLSPKAHGRDGDEPGGVPELGGGVALEREERVLLGHAAAVVAHPDQREPALLDVDLDLPRARVERVLDELLHDGRGPLDDLAGGDLVDEPGREHLDPRHGLF